MKVIVTGATGFIGTALVRKLLERGDTVVALTRGVERAQALLGPSVTVCEWRPEQPGAWDDAFNGADAVVNLAGENVAGGLWTEAKKQRIYNSRIESTRSVVEAIKAADPRPSVLINASAVGYYGNRGAETLTESNGPGSDFLAQVVEGWEAAARPAQDLGVRVVWIRTGIVLGKGGGALEPMLLPFRLFAGGTMGDRGQWVSWIHLEDEVELIIYALTHPQMQGAVNAVAPNPVTMDVLSAQIGTILHRPSWVPFIGKAMKVGLGEAGRTVTASQRVVPQAAQAAGYQFRYSDSEAALRSILGS